MGLLIAGGVLVVAFALALLPRRDVPGRGLALLRCFFPSWRFFEDISPGPSLQVCSATANDSFGPWRDGWTPSPRTAAALIWNPRGNLELAYQSLVDQLWSELEEATGDPTRSITYRLVQRLVETECLRSAERTPGSQYRFRLTPALDQSQSPPDEPASFVSDPHRVGAP